jgi:hypothetical protein
MEENSMNDFIKDLPRDILSKFKNYKVPVANLREEYKSEFKDHDHVIISEDRISDFKNAEYSHFDLEGFDIYLESQYSNSEDHLFYIGVAEDTNILGKSKFILENKPSDIFRTLEKNVDCNFYVDKTQEGRDFIEFFVVTESGKYDTIYIVGISDQTIFDLIQESEDQGEIVQTILSEHIDWEDRVDPPDDTYYEVDLRGEVIERLYNAGYKLDQVGHGLFFGSIKFIKDTAHSLGYHFVSIRGLTGYIVNEKDRANLTKLIDSTIKNLVKYLNNKKSKVSESTRTQRPGI